MFIASDVACRWFCASGGADWEVRIFLIPHLSWGGPDWEFWAHTPIIKLTYLSHLKIFALGRSKLYADMLLSMQKPRASKRKIKSAEGPPKNLGPESVLFGRLPLAFFWSIGLSRLGLLSPDQLVDGPARMVSRRTQKFGSVKAICLLVCWTSTAPHVGEQA